MSFSCKKGEFDRCFNRHDRPVEESRPDRFPSLDGTIKLYQLKPCLKRKGYEKLNFFDVCGQEFLMLHLLYNFPSMSC